MGEERVVKEDCEGVALRDDEHGEVRRGGKKKKRAKGGGSRRQHGFVCLICVCVCVSRREGGKEA